MALLFNAMCSDSLSLVYAMGFSYEGLVGGKEDPSGGGAGDEVAIATVLATLAGGAALIATATHGLVQDSVLVAFFLLAGWVALIVWRRLR
jgi:hypothetical protein